MKVKLSAPLVNRVVDILDHDNIYLRQRNEALERQSVAAGDRNIQLSDRLASAEGDVKWYADRLAMVQQRADDKAAGICRRNHFDGANKIALIKQFRTATQFAAIEELEEIIAAKVENPKAVAGLKLSKDIIDRSMARPMAEVVSDACESILSVPAEDGSVDGKPNLVLES